MSLKYGKAQIKRVIEVLDAEHETVEAAALACLNVMEDVFKERASFTVVGQLAGTKERPELDPADPEAIKLALGWYSTEGDARSAAESLWWSTMSGDRFRVWVLNVHHGTPAELHAKRKAHYVALEAKQADARQERLRKSIEKRDLEVAERARMWCAYGDPENWPSNAA